jgi:hypothetical protein
MSNNFETYESYLKRYPKSQHAPEVRSRMETIVIKGTLITKNNSNPIINGKVYLCEVGPKGEVDGNFSGMPQGKTDELGNFSLSVNRIVLSKIKCFVFIVQDGASVVFSDKFCPKNIPPDAMVIDFGKSVI